MIKVLSNGRTCQMSYFSFSRNFTSANVTSDMTFNIAKLVESSLAVLTLEELIGAACGFIFDIVPAVVCGDLDVRTIVVIAGLWLMDFDSHFQIIIFVL